jgi:3-hydroxyisobutyrate dehydrogenase-like beta-hydroxyacid dehydrogenase
MNAKLAGTRIGDASAIKMMRSVMIKGLEALTAESMLAARRAGVEESVLASLQASDPGIDWTRRSSYNLERMMLHGARRAAEMREVAKTLSDYGIPNRLAIAIAEWQDEIASLQLEGGEDDLALRLDRILDKRGA